MDSYLVHIVKNMKKGRIKNELLSYALNDENKQFGKFPIHKDVVLCSIEENSKEIIATYIFYVNVNKTTIINMIFNIDRPYPFYPPKIKIFGHIEYREMLQINMDLFPNENIECLCCSSLTCKNNWKPHKLLLDVFNEIKRNLELKMRVVDLICCKHVVDQKFGTYIPVCEFL